MYAATSELAVLCQILGHEFPGAYYAPHHRGYGVNALDNYDEMLQLGRVTKCPVRESFTIPHIVTSPTDVKT
jgi:N-acyl-D-amino-acid deacylase